MRKGSHLPICGRHRQPGVSANLHQQLPIFNSIFNSTLLVYFTKSSPDFVNSRGQKISASDQIDAFGQAQSIGWSLLLLHLKSSLNYYVTIVYLSVFIVQCFNVRNRGLSYVSSGLI